MTKHKIDLQEKMQKMAAQIMVVLSEHIGQAYNYKQITEMLGLKSKSDRLEVQDALFELAAAGAIKEAHAGRYKIPAPINENNTIQGTVDMTSHGSAYIVPQKKYADTDGDGVDEEQEDIFVAQPNLNSALHGDTVEVIITSQRRGRQPEGEVVRVIKRAREQFVGRLEVYEKSAFLVMDQRQTGGHDIFIPLDKLNGAENGQKAIAKIVEWPAKAKNPIGEIVDVLGNSGENQTEMHAILAEFGLPYSYPEDVASLAERINDGVTPEEIAKRMDLRGVTTFTIDPADAKDFDDALSLRKLADHKYEVGVHIADVTHYVTPGTKIDEEGYNRATSVYLVDRTIPMLPERLSNFLCSLRPNEEKLTYSVIFTLNKEAEILDAKITKSVIKSDRRFTYEEAQERIEGAEGDYKEEILILNDLAQKLRAKRFANGAIGFERAEVRFHIDENGKPIDVYFKEAKESNMLVEEFMLLANRHVAEYIGADKLKNETGVTRKRTPKTFVYRVHDEPNEQKYDKFAQFVKRFGYEAMPKKNEHISGAVTRILKEVKGKGEENLIETLALRTMAKAVYTTKNIGHYGLAFDYYTHFTSPIRRYPDMMVHRLLFSYMNGGKSANGDKYEDMCKHCSEREILAADAERESIKYKQVEFLLDRVGEEFPATISGVTEWGIYAEIDENKCEGMISIRDLDDDSYYFDEDNYCIAGRYHGHKFQLGDKIRIRVANANLEKKQLDFAIAGSPLKDIEKQNLKAKEQGLPLPGSIVSNTPTRSANKGKSRKEGSKSRKPSAIPPKSVLKKSKSKDKSSKKGGRKKR
ncbi:MAG: ribonuclease R [Marinilabiliaceae bacterium]|nr:ribonuclease R [Marinilabiliaceae bacterium]